MVEYIHIWYDNFPHDDMTNWMFILFRRLYVQHEFYIISCKSVLSKHSKFNANTKVRFQFILTCHLSFRISHNFQYFGVYYVGNGMSRSIMSLREVCALPDTFHSGPLVPWQRTQGARTNLIVNPRIEKAQNNSINYRLLSVYPYTITNLHMTMISKRNF